MSQALTALESYLKFSKAMLGAAEAEKWDDLARIGNERSVLAANVDPATQWSAAEQAPARALIEHCQQLDRRIRTLVEERQKALRVLLRGENPLA